jgi:hypothetical protein
MRCVVSTQAAHRIDEDVVDSKPVIRAGVITVSIAVTLPVSY